MNNKIKDLIAFLKDKYPNGVQMFNTRNIVGDLMYTIYDENGITVDENYEYSYIEIFGLTENEFDEINKEINKNNRSNLMSTAQLFEKVVHDFEELEKEIKKSRGTEE